MRSQTFITDNHITHVVNCAALIDNTPPPGVEYHAIAINDCPSVDIVPYLPGAISFIQTAMLHRMHGSLNENVLVCCAKGISRSASIVIAYIIATNPECRTFDTAHNFVKVQRPIIYPNLGFCVSLSAWAESLTESDYVSLCAPST